MVTSQLLKRFSSILIFFVLTGCSSNEVYYKFQSFQNSMWNIDDICRFDIPVEDTLSTYNIVVEIRNKSNYPFRNLWLFVDCQSPKGEIRRDTLNCELADIYGKWYGAGISIFSLSILYEKQLIFPKTGTYIYRIRHGMRYEDLKGISDIGIKIVKMDTQ